MKIWCLRCGTVLDEVSEKTSGSLVCLHCGEKTAYSAGKGSLYIAILGNEKGLTNNRICIQEGYRNVC